MFVNYSNHSSLNWSKNQLDEAKKYGDIVDISFYQVNPELNSKEVKEIADEEVNKILVYQPKCVMVQGEMSLTYAIVKKLRELNIKTVVACSERKSIEISLDNGETEKKSYFKFRSFREYI